MSADSPRHARSGGPLTVPSQPPSDRSIIDAVSGFINDVTLSSSSSVDPKDVIQWARFETADINEPTAEGDSDNDISPLLLILGYGSGVQVWLIPPNGEAQEVLSWRQGTVRVLRILPTPQHGDCFASKRPLIALCDSASPGPTFCSLSFISIRGGEQVKSIKFKNPILDVLANKRSVVVSFSERFAVFDAATLEDRMAITTCYPCPCPLGGNMPINPLALGDRWLAYADKKLNPSKRSSGGCEGEGVTSYTATVLHAAKSLSKGLRGLGESVAHSLAGGRSTSQSPSPPNADMQQPGVVTILDIEGNEEEDGQDSEEPYDPIVAHFVAHSEAIIALKFDDSGMLLVTADRRGHDFHVFRINPHPCGPSLASVHHLYILHRGDTTAKVQDIAISSDSRWAAVSTLRGTTHVFAVSAYGGACGVRTHTQPRVVNRLSRFHRSAGLPIHAAHGAHAHAAHAAHARSGSPVADGMSQGAWFPNPRLPPYPLPVTVLPLAQLRPTANLPTHTITRNSSGRQRLSSLSEECSSAPLLARARFGLAQPPAAAHRPPAHAALYLVANSGCLLHLVLHPRPARNVPKEKICDDTPIELEVEQIAQWPLQRPPAAADLLAPLPPSNPLLQPMSCRRSADVSISEEERWLSQVEIVTHAGPHRRLWMGPQFGFKTYNCTGSNSSLSEAEAVEVETSGVARSNPVNMPGVRPVVPVLIDSGSASSLEHSPSDSYRRKSLLADGGRTASVCDVQLREDLAEAMKEDHGWPREDEAAEVWRGASAGACAGAGAVAGGVARAVGPRGTVVAQARAPYAPPLDPDLYTLANEDEGVFRPVLRAPAAAALPRELPARPLPRDTTIPVQPATPLHTLSPPADTVPLATHVVIPAALTEVRDWRDAPPPPPPRVREHDPDPDPLAAPAVPAAPAELDERTSRPPRVVSVAPDELLIEPKVARAADDVCADVAKDVNRDLMQRERDVRKNDSVRARTSARSAERESNSESLPKSKRPPDDIQPSASARVRVKKSPTPKSSCDRVDVNVKDNFETHKKSKVSKDVEESKEVRRSKIVKEQKEVKESKLQETEPSKIVNYSKVTKDEETVKKESVTVIKEERPFEVTLQLPSKKESLDVKPKRNRYEVRTEEQAWDMLLNEPEKPAVLHVTQQTMVSDKISEDTKPKAKKKIYKTKKTQDDNQMKADEDSFIEIHAIEEKQQPCSGELVSISTPYEDIEPSSSYVTKTKKSRSSKSLTPERKEEHERKTVDNLSSQEHEVTSLKSQNSKKNDNVSNKITEVAPVTSPLLKQNEILKEKVTIDTSKVKLHPDGTSDGTSCNIKESPKVRKSKSLSPYLDSRKSTEKCSEIEKKDVYVIDSTKEEFPEIQITEGNKNRKRSPQLTEKKCHEKEPIVDKPVKSWSSVAASKSVKIVEETEKKADTAEKKVDKIEKRCERKDAAVISDENPKSSKEISLQDKLVELCKRRDIMVAECDTPTDLNFVEEHHSVIQDLPPLEPLDFGLDDFKLEVMRDSLLETNDTKLTSPICKINIDDILSTIKETTSKAIETSTFNLIDMEKVPEKKEKGFSVVESDKITTQEVKIDDEVKHDDKDLEIMEKSSDEDNTSPIATTDSDKEDKKSIGASNVAQRSTKQPIKSKKARKKRK